MGSKNNGSLGLGSSFQGGTGNVGSNSAQFTMPTDLSNTAQTNPNNANDFAGLTGTQSGMTLPDFSNSVSPSGNYAFNMPSGGGSGPNLNALGNALGKGSAQLGGAGTTQNQLQQQMMAKQMYGGGGKLTLPSKQFSAPVVALPMASGTPSGNSLLQMMQQYRPGTRT